MKEGFTFFRSVSLVLLLLLLANFAKATEDAASDFFAAPTTALNDTLVSVEDTVYIQIGNCSDRGQLCIDIAPVDISNFQITNNGFPYTGGVLACDIDTVTRYIYSNLFGQGQSGPYIVQSWLVNGEIFTGDFQVIDDLVDSMNVWDPTGNWTLDDNLKLISGGDAGNDYSDFVIWVVQINTPQFLDVTSDPVPRGTLLSFDVGINDMRITEFATGCVDSFRVQVACIQTETIDVDTLFPGEVDTFCLNFFELQGAIDPATGVTNICPSSGNVLYQFVNGLSCVEFTAINPGIDSACIVACDDLGFCDTTYIVVNVQDPSLSRIREYNEVVFAGQSGSTCLDTSQLGGPIDTIYSLCPIIDDNVNFSLDTSTLCVNYDGLEAGGIDTFCLVVCDATPLCDTNFVYVRVKRLGPDFVFDTLFLNQESVFCDFDLDNLEGTLINIQNACPGSSGTSVDFLVDNLTNCVEYMGVGLGQDTACIYLTDDQGIIDTTFLIVNILAPETATIFDTIRADNSVTYCLDTDQLGPNVLDTVFLCEEFTGTAVNFDINNVSLCIDVQALTPGETDTLCVYVCDELQSCDTTNYILTVRDQPNTTPPIANPDSANTPINTSVAIDVCANDSLFGSPLINFFVLPVDNGGVGPNQGIAFGNAECSVTYIPEQDTCGVDSFSYVIRTEMGWDTTTVVVTIDCPASELKIFNAFSPNGDQVNPFFRIDGIENFPDHQLFVYNRWGNLVLEARDYQNDWAGTWDGLDLPDGTYFYVFDDGEGQVLSGYVYLSR
ncbi:MAG: gliding motility-associated C-terminal domain-containing protein [Bacteroidota bacterium]